MTSTDGIYVDNRLILKADASGPKSARMVLAHPRVELAVICSYHPGGWVAAASWAKSRSTLNGSARHRTWPDSEEVTLT